MECFYFSFFWLQLWKLFFNIIFFLNDGSVIYHAMVCFKCIQFFILTWWVIFSNVNMMGHIFISFSCLTRRVNFFVWHDGLFSMFDMMGLVFMFYIMGFFCNLFFKLDKTGYFYFWHDRLIFYAWHDGWIFMFWYAYVVSFYKRTLQNGMLFMFDIMGSVSILNCGIVV